MGSGKRIRRFQGVSFRVADSLARLDGVFGLVGNHGTSPDLRVGVRGAGSGARCAVSGWYAYVGWYACRAPRPGVVIEETAVLVDLLREALQGGWFRPAERPGES